MKVIDLLNKIAKGEELPKKIKFNNYIFNLDKPNHLYRSEYDRDLTFHLKQWQKYALDEEIEIIEEEKEIEHYDMFDYFTGYEFGGTDKGLLEHLEKNFENINHELAYLIGVVNEIKKEGK